MDKTCTGCQQNLPLDAFRSNPKGKHGRYSKCRECEAKRRRAKEGSPERAAAYKRYRQSPKGRAAQARAKKKYRASERGRATDRAYYQKRRWYMLCKAAVNNAVQAGRLQRAQDVECCGVNSGDCSGPHEWHHDSYRTERWLDVRCFCKKHHDEWHRANTAEPCEKAGEL